MRRYLFLCVILLFASCNHNVTPPENKVVPDNAVSVKDYGAKGDGITKDDSAFVKAMNAAHAQNKILFIPVGTYVANIRLTWDDLKIQGQKQPEYNNSNGTLLNGALILGSLNANAKRNIVISDLGIQSKDDALVTGDGASALVLNQEYKNISLAGAGYLAYNHGFLSYAGGHLKLTNINVYNFYHGIALRCSNVVVDSVNTVNCGFTSIVVKSAPGGNELAENIVIKNVNVTGNPKDPFSRGGAIMVQAFTDNCITRHISISNIKSEHAGVATILIEQNDTGKIEDVTVTHCTGSDAGDSNVRATYDITGGTDITLSDCTSLNSNGIGFRCGTNVRNVKVISSLESGSQVAQWKGNFTYLQLNGKEIIK